MRYFHNCLHKLLFKFGRGKNISDNHGILGHEFLKSKIISRYVVSKFLASDNYSQLEKWFREELNIDHCFISVRHI